ncbi:MAG: hypothetical protein K6C94_09865, partial [Candidatus Gastranaerophilales bacterium]|nr:hypothetical protein [Candidatus Gastranaerophilales bacterium]
LVCQKDTKFYKVAVFSVKLLPLLFLFIVWQHPFEETMVCNKDLVCTVEHKYFFNINTKKQFAVNDESKLYFKLQRVYYLPVWTPYNTPHPFKDDNFNIIPIMQDSNKHFQKIFLTPSGCKTSHYQEAVSFVNTQKNDFETYTYGSLPEFTINIDKNISETNIFLIVFSLILIVWFYILYRKNEDEYIKGFYVVLLAYIIMQAAKLIEGFQYL